MATEVLRLRILKTLQAWLEGIDGAAFGPDFPGNEIYTDITTDVARVIEHELGGKFTGNGWRTFKELERA